MKKKTIYIAVLLLFAVATGFIVLKYKNGEKENADKIYTLLPRKASLASLAEWSIIQKTVDQLVQKIKANRTDSKSALGLVAIYLQEARITANYSYYDKAGMKLVNEVLSTDPGNFEALTYKSMILLSQHHFADGLAVAQDAEKINPYNAFLYGLLVDGNIESGHYDSAIANADKMVSIRPDLRSYSRISYIREIYGDHNGAIRAMQMAVNAGASGDEATEWSRIQLAKLYEHTGDLKYAEMNYTIALNERPGYAYAIAGMARLSVAAKNYDKAIELYKQADASLTDYSFKQELAELYELTGKKQQATALYEQIVKDMETAWTQSKKNDSVGHYADREMAYAYLNVKDYDKALEHAMMEYNRRPDNIDVNETVAWVDYNIGTFSDALNYIQTALKTKCKNPVLLCQAGLINYKAGNKSAAKELLQEGLKNDPSISITLKTQARQVLSTL